jgi:hypothetical protein
MPPTKQSVYSPAMNAIENSVSRFRLRPAAPQLLRPPFLHLRPRLRLPRRHRHHSK